MCVIEYIRMLSATLKKSQIMSSHVFSPFSVQVNNNIPRKAKDKLDPVVHKFSFYIIKSKLSKSQTCFYRSKDKRNNSTGA